MAFTPLNSLNAFIAVARRLSYAGAAKDLGVSPSALSQSVRQLEERLEVTLLTRTSRSVALTDAGRRLLEHAGPAVDQALESLRTVTAKPGEITGRVRLTVPSSAVALVLARVVPAFVQQHPKVELDLSVNDSFVNAVAEGFDGGIRLIEAIDRDMIHVRLTGPARIVVVGSPAYLKVRGVPQKPADLLHHDCIGMHLTASGEPWAWELERGKKTYRVPVRGPVVTNDFPLMRTLAVAGVGLHYALEPGVAAELASGKLRVVLESYAPEVPGLFLYYPSRAQISPALQAFVQIARSVMTPERRRRKPAPSA
jgi:DNA-binding transcriptional LysR family regulator